MVMAKPFPKVFATARLPSIKENPMPSESAPTVLVYTKSRCPYCVSAKNLLNAKGVTFQEIYLDDHPEEYAKLKERSGMMTVPQIFINDKLVGGYDDLSKLDRDGKLDAMLGK